MVVDEPVVALLVAAASVVAWGVRMEVRVRALEKQTRATDAYQRIILRGLVRMGVVMQEELDNLEEKVKDEGARA